MLFKTENPWCSMLVIGQTSILTYAITRRRTYRQRKKPCIKNADALKCAVRHRRCEGCPFNDFFKPEKPLKSVPKLKKNTNHETSY